MTEQNDFLFSLIRTSSRAAELLSDAALDGCRACVSQISDLNRSAFSELAEGERLLFRKGNSPFLMQSGYAVARAVAATFDAAMLLPERIPRLLPLEQVTESNAELAKRLLVYCQPTPPENFHFYSFHLCANKGRGAEALLLKNYCATDAGRYLLPMALALGRHRLALEDACSLLACHFSARTCDKA